MTETIRVAAAGDIHCAEPLRERITRAFTALRGQADVVLLAGDLTTHGDPAEAAVLADACRSLELPVYAVLGNHDFHLNRCDELIAVLEDAGITVLQRAFAVHEVGGVELGIVGGKGFVGGFPGAELPDFGEPLLREVYAETTREVEAIEAGLEQVSGCHRRIVLLHYAPVQATLEGEPEGIHTFLGSERLAPPIDRHRPDLVLHGHAHAGRLRGAIGDVPVYNVSVPVMQRDFWLFELTGAVTEERADVTLGTA